MLSNGSEGLPQVNITLTQHGGDQSRHGNGGLKVGPNKTPLLKVAEVASHEQVEEHCGLCTGGG